MDREDFFSGESVGVKESLGSPVRTVSTSVLLNPRSIVIVNPPRGLFRRVNMLNSFFKRSPGLLLSGKVSASEINELKDTCRKIAKTAWETLSRVYPLAYSINITDWMLLNDDASYKEMLVNQFRNRCFVALPRVDEVAMLYMVVKHMCIVRGKLRWTVDPGISEVLKEVGNQLIADLDRVLSDLKQRGLVS